MSWSKRIKKIGRIADIVLPVIAIGLMIVLPGIAGFINVFIYKAYGPGLVSFVIMVGFIYWAVKAWKRKEV